MQKEWEAERVRLEVTEARNAKTIAEKSARLEMLLQWALRDAQARAALSKANFSFAEDIAVPETDATNGTSTIASAVSEAEVAVGGAEGEEVVVRKYLYFRPRYGAGINNQLEEFWYALQLALLIGRGLVLPMIGESITWYKPNLDRLYPFDLFFDAGVVQQLLPVISTEEWKQMCNSTVDVDIFPAKKSQIMQKQYEFHLKINWQGAKRVLVKNWKDFQLQPLPDCLGVQWAHEMIDGTLDRGRLLPGDPPLGGLVERNAQFQVLRRHTIPAPHVMKRIAPFTKMLGRYLAIHVRVGDFRKWCGNARDKVKCPSDEEHALKVKTVANKHQLQRVFVACAPEFMKGTLTYMRTLNPGLEFHIFRPEEEPFRSHPDVVGVAEQQICIEAAVFIGNAWSTWTRSVHELRYTSGRKCETDYLWGIDRPWCVPKAMQGAPPDKP
jgi:hypothetical protein